MIKLKNKRTIDVNEVTLEDVVLERNVVLRFLDWLWDHNCDENLAFWLETQNFKYLKTDEDIGENATRIYDMYLATPRLNIDDPHCMEELEERRRLSDRTLFMGIQNVIWGLLKLESFPKFKTDLGKNMTKDISKSYMRELKKKNTFQYTSDLYDKFLELNRLHPQTTLIFKPNILPFDAYNEHTNLNLPPIGELWKDRDMMIAFRQYLYTKYSHENLSYYLYAEVFKLCPDDQLEQICNEIYENFFFSYGSYSS